MRKKISFSVKLIIFAAAVFLFASVSSAQDSAAVSAEAYGDFTDRNIGVYMVYVKGGAFTMGCTAEQGRDCNGNEKPAHGVTLGDFFIGRYEVTQKQWKALMGGNPSLRQGDDLPVENVNWDSVKVFIDKLNALMGDDYWEYRLPTEAEWEYAARGGAGGRGYAFSGGGEVGAVAWYEDNGGGKANPVGGKAPNELGIYDMSGNVWELVGDWFGNYDKSPQVDPVGPSRGTYRVRRGGGWSSGAKACRVSHRMSLSQGFSSNDVGFRLSMGLKKAKPELALAPMSQLALLKPNYVKTRRSEAVFAPVDTVQRKAFQIKNRSLRSADKLDRGISVGVGGFYGGDYGGGILWANREELAMPYGGGGAYMFVDAVYAEAFIGYSGGGGKWRSQDAVSPGDLPLMSRSYFNSGVLLKYPMNIGVGASSVFPLLGVDYESAMTGNLTYANGNSYEFYKESWRYDADVLSALWLKAGCGVNLSVKLIQSAYLRAEVLYGFRTANAFEKQDAGLSAGGAETRQGHGLTCRVGVGVKLL
jgi:formylglycine-generating enzyme required for sulfatase activity